MAGHLLVYFVAVLLTVELLVMGLLLVYFVAVLLMVERLVVGLLQQTLLLGVPTSRNN